MIEAGNERREKENKEKRSRGQVGKEIIRRENWEEGESEGRKRC